MNKGSDSWGYSIWRREGSGRTLQQPFRYLKGAIRKIGTNLLAEPFPTGLGITEGGLIDRDEKDVF